MMAAAWWSQRPPRPMLGAGQVPDHGQLVTGHPLLVSAPLLSLALVSSSGL